MASDPIATEVARSSSAAISSSSPLPAWLSRHINVAYSSDDVAALIFSIESSQASSTSGLPYLPVEILLHILEFIPVAYVLEFRRVCRGFREYIDTGVLYSYLSSTELLGYIGPRKSLYGVLGLHEDSYDDLQFMHARFSHLEASKSAPHLAQAKWSQPRAIFKISDTWFDNFSTNNKLHPDIKENLLDILCARLDPSHNRTVGTLSWCVRLDEAVLDIEFQAQMPETEMKIDYETRTISMRWIKMFQELLCNEMKLRKLMEKEQLSEFTFSHQEDCLRAIRRQRFRSKLDMNNSLDRQVNWSLGTLPPLFGKPRHYQASPPWDQMESAENEAIRVLMLLRREAALTSTQLLRLKALAIDREAMVEDLNQLTRQFMSWKDMLYKPHSDTGVSEDTEAVMSTLMRLPRNPVEWSDETIAREELQVNKWKTQKATRKKLEELLQHSKEELSVPEDAFDDTLFSDI